jgi:hypothetical protein
MLITRSTAVCVLAVFTVTAPASAQAPSRSIVHKQFDVMGANDEWTNTGLQVTDGDIVLITAVGKVTIGAWNGAVGPDGNGAGEGRLNVKVGATSVHSVGARLYLTAPPPSVPSSFALQIQSTRTTLVRSPSALSLCRQR